MASSLMPLTSSVSPFFRCPFFLAGGVYPDLSGCPIRGFKHSAMGFRASSPWRGPTSPQVTRNSASIFTKWLRKRTKSKIHASPAELFS
jgi:hypothetical protein